MCLTQHRSNRSHLHHQPLQHLVTSLTQLGHKSVSFISEINQYRTRFHKGNTFIAIDQSWNFVVRTDFKKLRRKLLIPGDINSVDLVWQLEFLQHNRNFSTIRCAPRVKVVHLSPWLSTRKAHYNMH